MVFNTGSYTVLPDNSILITANMQSETGFRNSHQLKSYVASKSRMKLSARAVLSADAGLLVELLRASVPTPFADQDRNDMREWTQDVLHHAKFYTIRYFGSFSPKMDDSIRAHTAAHEERKATEILRF